MLTSADDYGDFVGMALTSRPQHANVLTINASDVVNGSLPVASWVRTDRVVTLNVSLVT